MDTKNSFNFRKIYKNIIVRKMEKRILDVSFKDASLFEV